MPKKLAKAKSKSPSASKRFKSLLKVESAPVITRLPYQSAPKADYILLEIEAGLFKTIMEMAQARKVSTSDLIRLGLRNLTKTPKFFGLSDLMGFGKYAREKVETVIKIDPGYVSWACEHVDRFKLNEEAQELLASIDEDAGEIPF